MYKPICFVFVVGLLKIASITVQMNVIIKAQGTSPANLLSRSGDTQTVKSVTCCLTVRTLVSLLHAMLDQFKITFYKEQCNEACFFNCLYEVRENTNGLKGQ